MLDIIEMVYNSTTSITTPPRNKKRHSRHSHNSCFNSIPPIDVANSATTNAEIESLRAQNRRLKKQLSLTVDRVETLQREQIQCHDNFRILKEKYDDLKSEMHHVLWDVLPSLDSSSSSGLGELRTIRQAFETENSIGEYDIGELLGEGQFADVRLGTHSITNKKYAVKILPKRKVTSVTLLRRIRREIHVLKQTGRHPNIVTFVDVVQSPTHLYVLTELGGRDLFDFFDENPMGVADDERAAREIALGITRPVTYLHEMGICHRDLKPENVLLLMPPQPQHGEGGPIITANRIQICDFGQCAVDLTSDPATDLCGSPGFFAPEMILGDGENYDGFLTDVWSIGCIMLELTLGHDEFCRTWMASYDYNILQDESLFRQALQKALMQANAILSKQNSSDLVDFLSRLLVVEPSMRMTSKEMLAHPWLMNGETSYQEMATTTIETPQQQLGLCHVENMNMNEPKVKVIPHSIDMDEPNESTTSDNMDYEPTTKHDIIDDSPVKTNKRPKFVESIKRISSDQIDDVAIALAAEIAKPSKALGNTTEIRLPPIDLTSPTLLKPVKKTGKSSLIETNDDGIDPSLNQEGGGEEVAPVICN